MKQKYVPRLSLFTGLANFAAKIFTAKTAKELRQERKGTRGVPELERVYLAIGPGSAQALKQG